MILDAYYIEIKIIIYKLKLRFYFQQLLDNILQIIWSVNFISSFILKLFIFQIQFEPFELFGLIKPIVLKYILLIKISNLNIPKQNLDNNASNFKVNKKIFKIVNILNYYMVTFGFRSDCFII